MKAIVEITPKTGDPFDLTLEWHRSDQNLDVGSWSCVPGRMRFADGRFQIERENLIMKHGEFSMGKLQWFGDPILVGHKSGFARLRSLGGSEDVAGWRTKKLAYSDR